MSSEPERPIEKLLRACAKEKRERAKGSWELHPATRKLLQGEVARRFGNAQKSPKDFWPWLLGQVRFRPLRTLSVLAVPVLAILLVLPVLLTGKRESVKDIQRAQAISSPSPSASEVKPALAYNEPNVEEKSQSKELLADNKATAKDEAILTRDYQPPQLVKDAGTAARAPLEQAQPTAEPVNQVAAAEREALSQQSTIASSALSIAPSAPPAQPFGLADGFKPANASAGGQEVSGGIVENQLVLARKATAAPAAPVGLGATSSTTAELSEGSRSLKQSANFGDQVLLITNVVAFQQLSRRDLKTRAALARQTPPASKVLVSFQVEQEGQQMRVIDSDGSVYSGLLQSPDQVARSTSLDTQARVADALKGARAQSESLPQSSYNNQISGQYNFQVIGTNRSLNQRVVFSGTLNGITNKSESERGKVQAVSGTRAGREFNQSQQLLQNSRLSGTAVIGLDQKIEVEATSVTQPPLR